MSFIASGLIILTLNTRSSLLEALKVEYKDPSTTCAIRNQKPGKIQNHRTISRHIRQ
jgi:hypothetical protein